MQTLDIMRIEHDYEEDESFNINSVGCPDHCTGCGHCDHFADTHITTCNVITPFYQSINLCQDCHDRNAEFYTKDRPSNIYEIPSNEGIVCWLCDSTNTSKYYYIHHNEMIPICSTCMPTSNVGTVRFRDTLCCGLCKQEFNLNCVDKFFCHRPYFHGDFN